MAQGKSEGARGTPTEFQAIENFVFSDVAGEIERHGERKELPVAVKVEAQKGDKITRLEKIGRAHV